MPPYELLVPFLVATSVFALTHGPGMFYMAVQTMAHGARAGWLSSLAFHLASYIHIFAAAFGVTVLLHTAPYLLVLLKLAGAGYLIWMGVRMILTPTGVSPAPGPRAGKQAFKDSLWVEVLNPKSALFYVAFLPQFTAAGAATPVWFQIMLLGALANMMFSVTDGLCILSARFVAVRVAATGVLVVWARRMGGGILMAMGAKVATEAA